MKNGKASCISAFAGLNGLRGLWVFNVFFGSKLKCFYRKVTDWKKGAA